MKVEAVDDLQTDFDNLAQLHKSKSTVEDKVERVIMPRKSKINAEDVPLLDEATAAQDALLLGAKPDSQKTEEELRASGMDSAEVDARVSMRAGG